MLFNNRVVSSVYSVYKNIGLTAAIAFVCVFRVWSLRLDRSEFSGTLSLSHYLCTYIQHRGVVLYGYDSTKQPNPPWCMRELTSFQDDNEVSQLLSKGSIFNRDFGNF